MLIKNPPVELNNNLLMLGTNEYPLYLYKGETEYLLFEGGTGAMGRLVLQQLDDLGISTEAIKRLVVTHAHPDHVMAVPVFRKLLPGLSVLASASAAQVLGSDKAIAFFEKVDGGLTSAVAKTGAISQEHYPQPLDGATIPIDELLKDGDSIEIDGASFDVIETPGHSDCSLSFHEAEQKILIISDATGYYVPERDFWWPTWFSSYGDYIGSIERLAEYDTEILCLSHNAVIKGDDDVRAYFTGVIAATKAYHERIIAGIKAGMDVRELAGELGEDVFENTQLMPLDFFQKNCGLLVKLSLKHEGIALEK
jgi:glyoxylase-like metal-dependent hydrolase (beta-lactamase superfamily II)